MSWFEEGKVIVATTDGKTPTAGLEVAGENVVGTETLGLCPIARGLREPSQGVGRLIRGKLSRFSSKIGRADL